MQDDRSSYPVCFDQNAVATQGHWYYDVLDDTVNANGMQGERPSVKLSPEAASAVHATVVSILNL
ncbi:MAG: hypothetical protein CMF22_12070 [Idiomarinaceae bacterium]|nr:hypothetical protein [Idiomarinaceae bacterium]